MNRFNYSITEQGAKQSFTKAVQMLNKYNLTDLWCFCSQLSCLEFFSKLKIENDIFFPQLHFERVSMLTKAILASNTREYKKEIIKSNSLPKLFNLLLDATYFDIKDNNIDDPNKQLLQAFSKIANAQFQFQQYNIRTDLARTYLLYQIIPEQEEKFLKVKYKKSYVDIPKSFEDHNGLKIKEYLIVAFAIFALYLIKYGKFLEINPEKILEIKSEIENQITPSDYIFKILFQFIDSLTSRRNAFLFNPTDLIIKDSNILDEEIINKYLSIVSRSPKKLGKLLHTSVYRKGSISIRLSPLERYPILKLLNEQYLVPNMRYFDSAIEKLIHFEMQEYYPDNQFNNTFGGVFEKYVLKLIQERINDVIVIPEIAYKKKELVDGIDSIIIDSKNNALIAIEVKSKKISLDTRISPVSESFNNDMQRIYEALKKLPSKIEDLYAGLPEYQKWQHEINKIPKKNAICLVVLSGSLHLLPELINQFRLDDREHILNSYLYKYAIMPIVDFELLVELVYHNKDTLPSLLTNYWKSSRKQSPKEYSAQLFGGHSLDTSDYFLNKYSDELFNELEQRA